MQRINNSVRTCCLNEHKNIHISFDKKFYWKETHIHSILEGNTTIYFTVCIGPDCGAVLAIQWCNSYQKKHWQKLKHKTVCELQQKHLKVSSSVECNICVFHCCPFSVQRKIDTIFVFLVSFYHTIQLKAIIFQFISQNSIKGKK